MLAAALQAEASAYIDAHVDQIDEAGHRLVVRNGYHEEREGDHDRGRGGGAGVACQRQEDRRAD